VVTIGLPRSSRQLADTIASTRRLYAVHQETPAVDDGEMRPRRRRCAPPATDRRAARGFFFTPS